MNEATNQKVRPTIEVDRERYLYLEGCAFYLNRHLKKTPFGDLSGPLIAAKNRHDALKRMPMPDLRALQIVALAQAIVSADFYPCMEEATPSDSNLATNEKEDSNGA